jgi:hypothetical protein
MQPASESQFVLDHVMRVKHLNKLHDYHHRRLPRWHQYCGIQHFHLHDLRQRRGIYVLMLAATYCAPLQASATTEM